MAKAICGGSGGGIRTPDLWVMSPTSCRCSTPRHLGLRGSHDCVGSARSGLASHGVAPTVLSGAAAGSRPGSGWDRVEPVRSRPRAPSARPVCCLSLSLTRCAVRSGSGVYRRRHAAPTTNVPESMREDPSLRPLGRLSSSRLPAVHLPPINPVVSRGPSVLTDGESRLGGDSRLDAFSGSPVRT